MSLFVTAAINDSTVPTHDYEDDDKYECSIDKMMVDKRKKKNEFTCRIS